MPSSGEQRIRARGRRLRDGQRVTADRDDTRPRGCDRVGRHHVADRAIADSRLLPAVSVIQATLLDAVQVHPVVAVDANRARRAGRRN